MNIVHCSLECVYGGVTSDIPLHMASMVGENNKFICKCILSDFVFFFLAFHCTATRTSGPLFSKTLWPWLLSIFILPNLWLICAINEERFQNQLHVKFKKIGLVIFEIIVKTSKSTRKLKA